MDRLSDSSHLTDWAYQLVIYLAVMLLFLAAVLRSLLVFGDVENRSLILALLGGWAVLFILAQLRRGFWPPFFGINLGLQTAILVFLLLHPGATDFFAAMFAVLAMEAMQRYEVKLGAAWVALFVVVMAAALVWTQGTAQGLVFTLVYAAVTVFLAAYVLFGRRAAAARSRNRALVLSLNDANRQLRDYSQKLENLAVARERNRLARELHDSVTQTIFSMSLAAQSATVLVDRDPARVGGQLERLDELTRAALSEMQLLISELRPDRTAADSGSRDSDGGLVAGLQGRLRERALAEGVTLVIEVDGDGPLSPDEQQALFRIAQEAVNNIIKHAAVATATIRLRLRDPLRMEIEDEGRGFDREQPGFGAGVGLGTMAERAAEIGWTFAVASVPGGGTRVVVERAGQGETREGRPES